VSSPSRIAAVFPARNATRPKHAEDAHNSPMPIDEVSIVMTGRVAVAGDDLLCQMDYIASASQQSVVCPECAKPLTVDFTGATAPATPDKPAACRSFKKSSILSRFDTSLFQVRVARFFCLPCSMRWRPRRRKRSA
jgi:hypothetical protein